jgi:hypothetical protein
MDNNPAFDATHEIADMQHGNTPVARFSFPSQWKASSQVTWKYENIAQPVSIYAVAYNPSGPEWVEMLPVESFYWLQPNFGFDQPGSFKFGQFLLQPMPVEEVMSRWIVPRYRGNRQGLSINKVQPLPNLPKELNMTNQQAPLYGVVASIEYNENGKTIEEEIYGVMIVQQAPPTYGSGGTIIQTNWGFARLFCFRAEKDKLEGNRPGYWKIIQSVKANPGWEQQVCAPIMQQIQQGFQQHLQAGYDQINAATRMSQMISAQNDSFLQHQQQKRNADAQAWEQKKQQEAQSQAGYTKEDAFGDTIMGRETYHDPYYQYGSQHSGYNQYVWTNGQGEYQYSNDANFDPNLGAVQGWTLMQKKNVGDA